MNQRPHAPAVARNRDAILAVLRSEFGTASRVLEIGSGTGEHAVFFARAMPSLLWQTSDRRENHSGIRAWIQHEDLPNVVPPLVLDVATDPDPGERFDAAFAANTAHIMNIAEVEAMFALVSRVVDTGGRFCLYGPFRQNGAFKGDGNARFHESLRRENPEMGIRDIEELDAFATAGGLGRIALHDMPANNHIAVWVKEAPAGAGKKLVI